MQDIKKYLTEKCQKGDMDSLGDAFQKMQKELKSLINHGDASLKQKCYEEAIEAFQKAINLDDKDADSWNGLGCLLCAKTLWRGERGFPKSYKA